MLSIAPGIASSICHNLRFRLFRGKYNIKAKSNNWMDMCLRHELLLVSHVLNVLESADGYYEQLVHSALCEGFY